MNMDFAMNLTERLLLCTSLDTGLHFIDGPEEESFISYRDLHSMSSRFLASMKKQGAKPGDEIVIQLNSNKNFLVTLWACILGRMIPVPLSMARTPAQKEKLKYIWNKLNSPHLVTDQADPLSKVIPFEEHDEIAYYEREHLSNSEGSIVLIQFSSGSTGNPKGVTLTNANLISNTSDIIDRSKITSNDVLLSWMPLAHDMGLIGFHFTAICAGVTQVIVKTEVFIRNPLLWMSKVSEFKASVLYSPNFGYEYFLQAYNRQLKADRNWDLSSVRIIYNGAEPISIRACESFTDTMAKYGLRANSVLPAYGLAEASVAVTIEAPGIALKTFTLDRNHLKLGDKIKILQRGLNGLDFVSNGTPINNCQLRICDKVGNTLPEQHIGHIQIKGKNVTSGYYNEDSARLFTTDGWLLTGDLGFLKDGLLVVTGREKDIIIINGQNYYPHDIERILHDEPKTGPGKVAVAAVRVKNRSEEPAVFIEYKDDTTHFQELAAMVRSKLTAVLGLPVQIIVPVRKIPKTTSGKIQRFKLARQFHEGEFQKELSTILKKSATDESSTQSNTREAAIEQILFDLTGLQPQTWKTSMFDDGFTSLILMQLAGRLQQRFNVDIQAKEILENPTVASLADLIGTRLLDERYSRGSIETATNNARKGDEDTYALSYPQQRMWLLSQFQKSDGSHNLPVVFQWEGTFNIDHFSNAIDDLIKRYEILRTYFVVSGGIPFQKIIAQPASLSIRLTDHIVDDTMLYESMVKESRNVIKLDQWPLFRIHVYLIDNTRTLILWNFHHIIADGWSIAVLRGDLVKTYRSLLSKDNLRATATVIQYKDYTRWLNAFIESDRAEKSKVYWSNAIRDVRKLDFPTSFIRPAIVTDNGSFEYFSFPATTINAMAALSRSAGSSQFMTMLSVLYVLFYKYTAQTDLVIGAISAGRADLRLEDQLGYFLNMLPVRLKFNENDTFFNIILKTKTIVLEAFENQTYPFEKMVEDLDIEQDASKSPVFDVVVSYRDFGDEIMDIELNKENVRIKTTELHVGYCLSDLFIEFIPRKNSMDVKIKYRTDLFSREFIVQFKRDLATLTDSVLSSPDASVKSLRYLDRDAEKKILTEFSLADVNVEPPMSVVDSIEHWAHSSPAKTAVIFGDKNITYGDLDAQANHLSEVLTSEYKVRTGDRIGIMMGRSERLIISILAVLKSGASYVPIDMSCPTFRIKMMLEDCGADLVIVDKTYRDELNAFATCVPFCEPENLKYRSGKNRDLNNAVAYILYTSGSTGAPKGVVVTHENLKYINESWRAEYQLPQFDVRLLQLANVTFDVFTGDLCRALTNGGTLVLSSTDDRVSIHAIARLISDHHINIFETTPAVGLPLLDHLLKSRANLDFLRIVILGSDVCTMQDLHTIKKKLPLHVRILNSYGTTETTIDATYLETASSDLITSNIVIGRPMANTKAYILDDHEQPVGVGIKGNLYVGGKGVGRGYLNNPELTWQKFKSNPFAEGEMYYSTGDKASWLPDGNIAFCGRNDMQVKIRGIRIEPSEVEYAIRKYPGIKQVVITGVDSVLRAYYTSDGSIEAGTLKEFLVELLPSYMIPSVFVHLETIPLSQNGKIDLHSLPIGTPEKITDTPPETETERSLARIWSYVLKCNVAGRDADFFELGGHSLTAAAVVFHIQDYLSLEVALRDVFLYPTIRSLAAHLAKTEKYVPASSPEVTRADTDTLALTNAQMSLWLLQKINPGLTAYNIQGALIIEGELNIDVFSRAISDCISRHDALRVFFPNSEEGPVQKIIDADDGPTLEVIANELDIGNVDRIFRDHCFNIEETPPVVFKLLKTGDGRHVFVYNFHHIVIDLWSTAILLGEVSELYSFYTGKRTQPVFPRSSYINYVGWQQAFLKSTAIEKHRQFWLGQFSDGLTPLDLPADHPRPLKKTFNGSVIYFQLNGGTYILLKEFIKAHNNTLFIVLMSALNILLSKYSQQRIVTVGYPTLGRSKAEFKDLIGFFVNTLPLRTVVNDDDTLDTLVNRVTAVFLDSIDHQGYPFNLIAEDLNTSYDMSRSPLFDVFLHIEEPALDMAARNLFEGLTVYSHKAPVTSSKFDLTFKFRVYPDELILDLEFNTDLYTDETARRIAGHFDFLLKELLTYKDVPHKNLHYLSDVQQQQILTGFNVAPSRSIEPSFLSVFDGLVRTNGDRIAITHKDQGTSYSDLDRRASQIANYLATRNHIGPGKLVVLMGKHSDRLITTLLGIVKAKATFIPLDSTQPLNRIMQVLTNADPHLVIADSNQAEISHYWPFITLSSLFDESALEPVYSKEIPGDNTTAYIIFTSGSTGQPKGVMIGWASFMNYAIWCNDFYFPERNYTLPLFTSLSFDLTLTSIFPTLLRGDTIHIPHEGNVYDIIKNIFTNNDCRAVKLTPSHIDIVDAMMLESTSIEKVIVGGEALLPAHIKTLKDLNPAIVIYNEYGPTEATVGCTVKIIAGPQDRITIGKPIDNTTMLILDHQNNLCPVGVSGELCIGGDCLAIGYFKNDTMTQQRFFVHPQLAMRLYRSGDIAQWTSDGDILCKGRADNQLKILGHRIELDEISAALRTVPGIQQAIALAQVWDGEKIIVGYYSAKEILSPRQIRERLNKELPAYSLPRDFIRLEKLPLTSNGKIDSKALLQSPVVTATSHSLDVPAGQTEKAIFAIWTEVLKSDKITINDNFFTVGGNSLLLTSLYDKLNTTYPGKLNIADLFSHNTILQQATLLESEVKVKQDIKEIDF
jgi:amino acid adenylation domain-containing protein